MTIDSLRHPLSKLEKRLLLFAGLCVFLNLLLPIWRIYLWAPQYPEGLVMDIYARSLKGDLQNINILNHYIGMKPLSAAAFAEFRWMGPVLIALGSMLWLAALISRRWLAFMSWLGLFAFDLYMLYDLLYWMHNWGHDLDPRAVMKMAPFTPPVLGFKHVANFYIYSFPFWGGGLIVIASILGLYALWKMRKP